MELMLAMMGVNAGDRLPQPLRHRYWLRIPSEGMNQLLRPNWIEPWVIKKKWYKPWVKKLTWPKSVIAKFRLEVADLARNNTTLALFRTLTDNDVFVDLEVVYRALQERWEAESKEPSNDGGYYSSELPPPTPLLHPNGHTSMSPAATHHYDSASEEAH